jgi:transcriptional regulator GlxA family with amidase domain
VGRAAKAHRQPIGLSSFLAAHSVDVRICRNFDVSDVASMRYGQAMQGGRPDQRIGSPRRIGLVGFDGVAALDLAAVMDAFYIASRLGGAGTVLYELSIIGLTGEPFASEAGLRMAPDATVLTCGPLDTVVVPGGSGVRRPDVADAVGAWLLSRQGGVRRLVSVCTGAYGLAASGLLDGRRATTHWRYAADAARRFPNVRFEPDAIFIKDGSCYSSAGMTAAIDLALALIEEDHGPALALAAARQMVVYMRRTGGQLQYSEPLRAQTRAGDRFADLLARMLGDLSAEWSVEAMASHTGLGPRQFSRRFKDAFARSPADCLEVLRLDEARLRLATGADGMARIAHAVGFRSDDAFRRAFERRFGLTPGDYRRRFTTPAQPHASEPRHDHAQAPRFRS